MRSGTWRCRWIASSHAQRSPLTAHQTIGRMDGQTRALPFAVSVPVNYFNEELLTRAGHDPATLAAGGWPALLKAAQDVTALGEPVSGMFFDYASGQALTWQMLVFGNGGRMMSPDERSGGIRRRGGTAQRAAARGDRTDRPDRHVTRERADGVRRWPARQLHQHQLEHGSLLGAQHGLSRDDAAAADGGRRGTAARGGQRRGDHDAAAVAS